LGRYPNVWANFEVTASLMLAQPRDFAKILGELLMWAGPDQIMFATGATLVHPQPVIEEFWDNFQIPREMREEYGYPKVTEDVKRKILSENALRFLGKDPEELRETVQNDEWAKRRAEQSERPEPWSSLEATGTPPQSAD
jgi:predicted TIM-barrel fold metal-dependent hydrolase